MSSQEFGVHSEVGRLRKVLVCAPGRAHSRLTPSNCDDLLFDDVLWVETAKRDHLDFVTRMRQRGVDVVEMHDLLAQTVAIPAARTWILDQQIIPNQVGVGLVDEVRSFLDELPDRELADTLIGGLSTYEFPETHGGDMIRLVRDAAGVNEYLLPPLPNSLYTRDTTCWIYGGVTLNPLFWPARHEETLLAASIYQFHPDFAGRVNVWWGDPTAHWGMATVEGGDVMPIGNRTVLVGMSERTSRQGVSQVARALFDKGAADRVIVAALPKLRAAMHLDTVFTFADRDCVLLYPDIVHGIDTFSYYPADNVAGLELRKESRPFVDVVAGALDLPPAARRGDRRQRLRARAHPVGQRGQPGGDVPGRRVRLRPQHPYQHAAAQGGHRGRRDRGCRAGPGPRRRALHDVPDHPRPGRLSRADAEHLRERPCRGVGSPHLTADTVRVTHREGSARRRSSPAGGAVMARFVRYAEFGGPEVLTVVEGPEPAVGEGQVRVRVKAAGLNPVDYKIFHGGPVAEAFGVVPPSGAGNEYAGVIDLVGDGVTGRAVGDEVFGTGSGTLADYVVVPAEMPYAKPAGLSWEVGGSLGVAGRAACASVASLDLTGSDTVLVSAAAGGVGVLAAQLALAAGATVVGTASEANHAFLASLGVVPVAYGEGLVERLRDAAPQGYTAVLDNHGMETIEAGLALGVPAGRINTVASFGGPEGITFVGAMAATAEDVARLAGMLADGRMQLPIEAAYPLEAVSEAFARLMSGHLRGKIVLTTD